MGTARTYHACGLRILSPFPLPELEEVESVSEPDQKSPVVIRYRTLPETSTALSASTLVYKDSETSFTVYRAQDSYYWFYEGTGIMQVSNGTDIFVPPLSEIDVSTVQWFVLNPGLRTILIQRDVLVLHASVVDIHGATVAFAGNSGVGKSTLATACYKHGHGVLTDDIAPLHADENGATVTPSYSRLNITQSVAEALEVDTDHRSGKPWYGLDISDQFVAEPEPLKAIYILQDGDNSTSVSLSEREALFRLLQESYAMYTAEDGKAIADHLRECAAVSPSLSMKELYRPRNLDRIDDVVSFVESDVEQTIV